MPPQAEFYTAASGTNVLSGASASQIMQTEYARVYNLRFDNISDHSGDIEVYWNGELAYAGPAEGAAGDDGVNLYVIGSGYMDALEIVGAGGGAVADPAGLEMVALDYADWSMIESRDENGQAAPGAPEVPPEVSAAAAASGTPNPPLDQPTADPPTDPTTPEADPTNEVLLQTVPTQDQEMYSVRFESPGGFDVYWNDELVASVPASETSVFTQLYVEGTGGLDTFEIEPFDGADLPTLVEYDFSLVVDDETADLAALMDAAVPVAEDGHAHTDEDADLDLLTF